MSWRLSHWHRWKQSLWRHALLKMGACVLTGSVSMLVTRCLMERTSYTPPRQCLISCRVNT
ncbi:TPA: hypothetical protein RXP04_005170 [Escherichia coli]|nr:hypothetical protein [Escherichia coli]HEA8531648.1 hypothetical protein [Escherichia coli]